jgi:hypothetical protein
MSNLSALATPAFAGEMRASVRTSLDQLERALAETLAKLKPGRSTAAAALHEEMQRLALMNEVLMNATAALGLPASALAGMVRHLEPSHVIEDALKQTVHAHAEALSQAGLPAPVFEQLQALIELTLDARLLQRQIDLKRAMASMQDTAALLQPHEPLADPVAPLSAAELGKALGGLCDETVRQRERVGELFSLLRPGRKRGREYPAFQAWPGIAGEPLAKVLQALGPVSGTVAYGFFTSPTDLLGGLTPIEATTGRLTSHRNVDADAQDLLDATPPDRLAAVLKAAQAYTAWQAA